MSAATMKHTPQIRLQAARSALETARRECPHWDYESDVSEEHYECCYRLDDAKREYQAAKKAAEHK